MKKLLALTLLLLSLTLGVSAGDTPIRIIQSDNKVSIGYNSPKQVRLHITVKDMSGSVKFHNTFHASDKFSITLNMDVLPKGDYVYEVKGHHYHVKKVLTKK